MSRLVKPKAPAPTVVLHSWCPADISQAEDLKLSTLPTADSGWAKHWGKSWGEINQTLLPC